MTFNLTIIIILIEVLKIIKLIGGMVMKTLDKQRMELVQVREAIDMAETVLENKDDATLRQQLVELRSKEKTLRESIVRGKQ